MFHVHSSYMPNMKNIKGNISPKQMPEVNTEPESTKSNDKDIFN